MREKLQWLAPAILAKARRNRTVRKCVILQELDEELEKTPEEEMAVRAGIKSISFFNVYDPENVDHG